MTLMGWVGSLEGGGATAEPRGYLSPLGGGASLPSPGGAPPDPPGACRARSCCTSSGPRRSSAGSCGKGCSCSCRARRAAGDEGLTARAVPTTLSSSPASRPRCSLPRPCLTPRPTVILCVQVRTGGLEGRRGDRPPGFHRGLLDSRCLSNHTATWTFRCVQG